MGVTLIQDILKALCAALWNVGKHVHGFIAIEGSLEENISPSHILITVQHVPRKERQRGVSVRENASI